MSWADFLQKVKSRDDVVYWVLKSSYFRSLLSVHRYCVLLRRNIELASCILQFLIVLSVGTIGLRINDNALLLYKLCYFKPAS